MIPVSNAPVLLTTASIPPSTIMKIPTSTAFSKPSIGAINTWESVAPTVPLPFTIVSPTNLAFGSKWDNIPRPNIRIRIMEKDDNIVFVFFLAFAI